VVRAQKLRTARPVNKNYRLLNILRNADVNKVGRPPSAVAEVLFVRSTISRQPAGRFMPQFACGRTLVPDLSSPLLGVNAPRGGGAKKGGNEIFVTIGVDGEFLHFGGF